MLAEIPPDTQADRYGEDGVVSELEERVARLLGKQAAVFLPSGTMAQQSTLRVHAERTGRTGVVFHPACHLDWRESRGYQVLHGLHGIQAGEWTRQLERGDLDQVSEEPAALLIELPQRNLGGQLPEWDELEALCAWAKERGAATHMDGARLWEAQPYYGRELSEIAGLFDSVYVSFYKGLGALAGCCVAGELSLVKEVAEWRRRHGGTMYSMWPNAASAMAGLDRRLGHMTELFEHAKQIALALGAHEKVRVLPGVPQAPLMHLFIEATREEFEERFCRLATDEQICTWPRAWPGTELPGFQRVEFTIGQATLGFSPAEATRVIGVMAGDDGQVS
jgi:threonine aldolase